MSFIKVSKQALPTIMQKGVFQVGLIAMFVFATIAPASAATSPIIVKCAYTMMGAAACGAIGTLYHEIAITKKPFGKNGEVRKFLSKPAGGHNSEVRKLGRAIAKIGRW